MPIRTEPTTTVDIDGLTKGKRRKKKVGVDSEDPNAASIHHPAPLIQTPATLQTVKQAVQHWSQENKNTRNLQTPFGIVTARHYNGAPYIRSQGGNYDNAIVGESYTAYIDALKSGRLNDNQIATALLNQDRAAFKSQRELRAAAMLHATVHLAEQWRKTGAVKIYRAQLRAISEREKTFDDFLKDFGFIASADEGRRQVGRIYDEALGHRNWADLPLHEKAIVDHMSDSETKDGRISDFSTDDEARGGKQMKTTPRLFAIKHEGKEAHLESKNAPGKKAPRQPKSPDDDDADFVQDEEMKDGDSNSDDETPGRKGSRTRLSSVKKPKTMKKSGKKSGTSSRKKSECANP